MTRTIYADEALTIDTEGVWRHADGRFLLVGDTESLALIYAARGAAPGNKQHAADLMFAIFSVMHRRAQA